MTGRSGTSPLGEPSSRCFRRRRDCGQCATWCCRRSVRGGSADRQAETQVGASARTCRTRGRSPGRGGSKPSLRPLGCALAPPRHSATSGGAAGSLAPSGPVSRWRYRRPPMSSTLVSHTCAPKVLTGRPFDLSITSVHVCFCLAIGSKAPGPPGKMAWPSDDMCGVAAGTRGRIRLTADGWS